MIKQTLALIGLTLSLGANAATINDFTGGYDVSNWDITFGGG